MLEIKSLRVDYGDFTAVEDFDLSLQPGEIFGLAGPNGAGKTSTIRVLATLLEPTYGDVKVAGLDLFETPDMVHQILGYMPDMAPVIPDLKVWEFLDLYARSYGFSRDQRRDRVDACLAQVKMADQRNMYGSNLSRGMTQRVVLAKTLLHDPALLLLDEPASGMDPIARRDMRQILQNVAARGATVIISSHVLSELTDLCTSVGVMHMGRLLRHGSIQAVLDSVEDAHVNIDIEVLSGTDCAVETLSEIADVRSIATNGSIVTIAFAGPREARPILLKSLIDANVEVASFTTRHSGIESVLMSVLNDDAR